MKIETLIFNNYLKCSLYSLSAFVIVIGLNSCQNNFTEEEPKTVSKYLTAKKASKQITSPPKKEIVDSLLERTASTNQKSSHEHHTSEGTINVDSLTTLAIYTPDSLVVTTDTTEVVELVEDELIRKSLVTVHKIETDTISVEKLLDVHTPYFGDEITVEFWESPLQLVGYELSRNQLKLFGFNPYDSIQVFNISNAPSLKVVIGDFELQLERTTRFKTLYL